MPEVPTVSERFRKAITESHRAVNRVDVMQREFPTPLATFPVKEGSVVNDREDPTHRSSELSFLEDGLGRYITPADGDELFRPFEVELQVWSGVAYPDGTEEVVPVALLSVTDYELTTETEGRVHRLTTFDRSDPARQAFEHPFVAVPGRSVEAVAEDMIRVKAPTMPLRFPITGDVVPALILPPSANGWEEAWKLFQSSGYNLNVNRLGVGVADPAVIAPAARPDWTYRDDHRDSMIEISRKRKRVPNHVIVRGTHPNVSGVVGEAFDSDPTSRTYVGTVGHITKTFEDERVTTSDQATRAAVLLLGRVMADGESYSATILRNPALELDQTAHLDRRDLAIDLPTLLDHTDLTVTDDEVTMSVEFRRTVRTDAELLGSVLG